MTATPGVDLEVFISYSSRDSAAVRRISVDLKGSRLGVWQDDRLLAGEEWWQTILGHIRQCSVLVFAVSDNSLASKPCLDELKYAEILGIPVLPVQIRDISGSIRISPLSHLQILDYRRPSAADGVRLVSAIMDSAARRRPLPDPLPPDPPNPYPHLSQISSRLDESELRASEQLDLVIKLKTAAKDGDGNVARDVTRLVRRLRDRSDVTLAAANQLDAILGKHQDKTSPESTQIGAEGRQLLWRERLASTGLLLCVLGLFVEFISYYVAGSTPQVIAARLSAEALFAVTAFVALQLGRPRSNPIMLLLSGAAAWILLGGAFWFTGVNMTSPRDPFYDWADLLYLMGAILFLVSSIKSPRLGRHMLAPAIFVTLSFAQGVYLQQVQYYIGPITYGSYYLLCLTLASVLLLLSESSANRWPLRWLGWSIFAVLFLLIAEDKFYLDVIAMPIVVGTVAILEMSGRLRMPEFAKGH